jgi:energy-coupling factor transport system permease protein
VIFNSSINLAHPGFGSANGNDSPLVAFDVRLKLLASAVLIAVIAITLNPLAYLFASLFMGAVIYVARLRLREVSSYVTPFLLIALATLVLHLLFSPAHGRVYLDLYLFKISSGNLVTGLTYAWRVMLFFAVALVFNFTTSALDLADGIVRLLRPLRIIRVPIDQLGLMMFLAMRSIPLLFDELRQIRAAQISRGVDTGGSLIKRIRTLPGLLSALLSALLRRADKMSESLILRGYSPGRKRSSIKLYQLQTEDFLFEAVFLLVMLILFLSIYHAEF